MHLLNKKFLNPLLFNFKPGVLLSSNTSSIPLQEIATVLENPGYY